MDVKIEEFLVSINWGDAIVTLLAAFFGAWFAYRFNLRQQKKWDEERKKEEQKNEKEKQSLQLNYLHVYLHAYIEIFYHISSLLKDRMAIYDNIASKNYVMNTMEEMNIKSIFVDTTYRFEINTNDFSFARNSAAFIVKLAGVETSIQRFNAQMQFFNHSVYDSVYNYQLTKDLKSLIENGRANLAQAIKLLYSGVLNMETMLDELRVYSKNYSVEFSEQVSYSAEVLNWLKQIHKIEENIHEK